MVAATCYHHGSPCASDIQFLEVVLGYLDDVTHQVSGFAVLGQVLGLHTGQTSEDRVVEGQTGLVERPLQAVYIHCTRLTTGPAVGKRHSRPHRLPTHQQLLEVAVGHVVRVETGKEAVGRERKRELELLAALPSQSDDSVMPVDRHPLDVSPQTHRDAVHYTIGHPHDVRERQSEVPTPFQRTIAPLTSTSHDEFGRPAGDDVVAHNALLLNWRDPVVKPRFPGSRKHRNLGSSTCLSMYFRYSKDNLAIIS